MDWRKFGVEHTVDDVGTFWIDKGIPYRTEIVLLQMASWDIDTTRLIPQCFIIVEGYVLEFKPSNDEHTISLYMKHRLECTSLRERWEMYQKLLRGDDVTTIYELWEQTRPKGYLLELDDANDNGVEKKDNTSKKRKNTPKAKEIVTES